MLGRNTESRQIISTNLHSCCGLRLFLLLEPVPLAETDVRGGDPVRELDPNTQLCPAHSLHHLRSVHSTRGDSSNIYLGSFSGVCFFFNSTLNPILYSVMSLRFRRGFRDMRRNVLQKMFNSSSQQSDGSGSKYSPRQRKRLASVFDQWQYICCSDTGYPEIRGSRSC